MGLKTRLSSYCTKRGDNTVNLVKSRKTIARLARPIVAMYSQGWQGDSKQFFYPSNHLHTGMSLHNASSIKSVGCFIRPFVKHRCFLYLKSSSKYL